MQAPPDTNFQPNFNICPTQYVPVCTMVSGMRLLKPMHWGLLPHWAKDKKYAAKMINARAETLEEKPSFKPLVNNNRCIIVISGFYEWHRTGKDKVPYKVERGDKKPMMLAGVWHYSEYLKTDSYSVLTTAAPSEFQAIHHRMPVIVEAEQVATWLEGSWAKAREIASPYEGNVTITEISSAVNSSRNNGPELLEPASPKLL